MDLNIKKRMKNDNENKKRKKRLSFHHKLNQFY